MLTIRRFVLMAGLIYSPAVFVHAAPIPPALPPDSPKPPADASNTQTRMTVRSVHRVCTTDWQGKQTCQESESSLDTGKPHAAVAVLDEFGQRLRDTQADSPLDLLDESAMIYEGGAAETKSQYALQHLKSDREFLINTKVLNRKRQVQLVNGMAVVTTVDTLQTPKGNVESAESAVLRQIRGAWKITHLHWSSHRVK